MVLSTRAMDFHGFLFWNNVHICSEMELSHLHCLEGEGREMSVSHPGCKERRREQNVFVPQSERPREKVCVKVSFSNWRFRRIVYGASVQKRIACHVCVLRCFVVSDSL